MLLQLVMLVMDGGPHRFVRNGHQMPFRAAHPRAPQADGFHRPFRPVQFDLVADAEGPINKNGDRAKEIGQRVLRRQADRQAADGQRGETAVMLCPGSAPSPARRR